MLPALNLTLAMILALAFLLLCIAGPFLLLWIGLSVRRDLRRIADSLHDVRLVVAGRPLSNDEQKAVVAQSHFSRVANSMFGR